MQCSHCSSTGCIWPGTARGRWSWRATVPRCCSSTATRTAPTPGASCWTAWPARSGARWRSTCPASATATGSPRTSRCWPSCSSFASAAVEWLAPDGGAVICGNSLGGCVALLLAQEERHGLAGVVPVAPAGLDMARWFGVINREPVLKTLLAAPVPVPPRLIQTVVGKIYRRLAFHDPGRDRPSRHPRVHLALPQPANRGGGPGHRQAAAAGVARLLRARADRLPGAAGVGPPRRDGL